MKISLAWARGNTNFDPCVDVVFAWEDLQIGFGEIRLTEDPYGNCQLRTEYMGKEFVKKLLCDWVDQAELKE